MCVGGGHSHRLKHLASEDLLDHGLAVTDDLAEPLGPLDRLCFRLDLDEGKAARELLRLGERPIGDRDLSTRGPNPRGVRTEAAGREQAAGFCRLLDRYTHSRTEGHT